MKIEISTQNLQDVLQELSQFPARVGRKHFRIALNAGAGLTKSAIASNMPRDTGLAARSLRVKVVVPAFSYNVAHHDKPARATVGVSRQVKRRMPRKVRGSMALASVKQSTSSRFAGQSQGPSAYLHLLENGTQYHVVNARKKQVLSNGEKPFGRWSVLRATPKKPVARAWAATKSTSEARIMGKLLEGIAKEAAIAHAKTAASANRKAIKSISRKIVNATFSAIRG